MDAFQILGVPARPRRQARRADERRADQILTAGELSISMPDAHDILFRTLADPTRRGIFERLCRRGEQTVGTLTAEAGVSQPAVSKHLGVLKQAGLVRDRHKGRQTHYRAEIRALSPLIDWTSQMQSVRESRFDGLEDLLKRMDQ